jgi:hypothetical protein
MRNCWSSKSSDVLIFLLLTSNSLFGQFELSRPDSLMPGRGNALEKYMFPIQPGKTAMLTGTMGELRSTHFHGGLDINTHTIGYAVRCANDGYIAYARMGTSGYGNSLIVQHPDGHSTLYAHLDRFNGPVADFIREERYKNKQSEIELTFEPDRFPVQRGDTIALSGNTGSSGGPHLHFELRDESGQAVNPMILGFDEIQDHVPPQVQRIALKTLDASSRINDQVGRFEFHTVRKGVNYHLPQPILASGRIGIELQAVDKAETSTFRFGINLIEMFVDSVRIFSQKIERIDFDESRNILALMDYPTLETRGARFNKLYIDAGNRLPYFDGTLNAGTIQLGEKEANVEVRMTDFHGNQSRISLTLRPTPVSTTAAFMGPSSKPIVAEIRSGSLIFSSNRCAGSSGDSIKVFSRGKVQFMRPAYSGKTRHVYLVSVGSDLPDSVVSCAGTWVSNLKAKVPPGIDYKFYSALAEVEFPRRALYDSLYLATSYDSTATERFVVGSRTTALHVPVRISLRPQRDYTVTRNLGVYRIEGNDYSFLHSTWKNGRVSFSTLSLGEFTLLRDSVPPTIKALNINGGSARLRIRDHLSGISYFEATINGEWLLMNYDYKSGVVYAERRDPTLPLKGDFVLRVVDQAGNEATFNQRIP